jgi:predicted nucleotidyltransferase component of viral defense system
MSIEIIQQRLRHYQCMTKLDEQNALKEIVQEISLMALARADFFKVAEFHGGTALRILYGLQRFSEDLDFALLKSNVNFSLDHFLSHMTDEFEAYGFKVDVSDRTEVKKTVQKQFLKVDSLGKLFFLEYPLDKSDRKIKIKFEVDTNPPEGAVTEIKYLTFPLAYAVLAKDIASSFSGKLHALLCRSFDKGRDWYDFIWYVSNKAPVNFILLKNALFQQGPWQGEVLPINKEWLMDSLTTKIRSINWDDVRNDVRPLLKANELASLAVWGTPFFMSQLNTIEKYM